MPDARHPVRPLVFGLVGALLFALFGGFWALTTPLTGAPDEAAHVVRAVAVARGELRGIDTVTRSSEPTGQNRVDTAFDIPKGYADLFKLNGCYVFAPEQPVGCAHQPAFDNDIVSASTPAGTYPPLYYALVGWPSRLFDSPGRGMWAMRLCSVAVSAALVGLALAASRRQAGGSLASAGVLVAITPMTAFMAAIVNPTGMEITAALALWTAMLALLRPKGGSTTRTDLVLVAVSFVVLCACRPISPAVALGIVGCTVVVAATGDQLRALGRRRDARVAGVLAVVGLLVSVAWLGLSKAYSSLAGTPIPGLELTDALSESFSRLDTWLIEVVGYFGYREAPAPGLLLVIWAAFGVAAVVGALVLGTWRQRAVLAALAIFSVLFNVVPEALSASEYGYIWQGRYSIPVAVGVPVLAAWIIGSSPRWRTRWSLPVTAVVAGAWVVGQALGQGAALRRSIEGISHPFLSFLTGDGWDPPLPAGLLWGALIVSASLFAGWCTLASLWSRNLDDEDAADLHPDLDPDPRPHDAARRPVVSGTSAPAT